MTQVLAVRTMGAAGIANQDLAGLIAREAPAEPLILVGGRARIRTGDLRIKSPLLCRLSYAPLTPRNIGRNIGLGPEPVNSWRSRLPGATAPARPPTQPGGLKAPWYKALALRGQARRLGSPDRNG